MVACEYQVVACGEEIELICYDPNREVAKMFDNAWAQYRPYARNSIEFPLQGTQAYGQTLTAALNGTDSDGQLLGAMYLWFTVPAIRHHSEPCVARREKYGGKQYTFDDHTAATTAGANASSYSQPSSSSSSSSSSTSSSSSSSSSYSTSSSSSSTNTSSSQSLPSAVSRDYATKIPRKDFAYYANCYGHVVVQEVALQIATRDVQRHWGEYMEVLDELSTPVGKNTDEMLGRFRDEQLLWKAGRREQQICVPLRFFSCENVATVLRILQISESPMRLSLKLNHLNNTVFTSDGTPAHLLHQRRELAPTDVKVQLFADVYYLGEKEAREMIADQNEYRLIFPQVQRFTKVLEANKSDVNTAVDIPLDFQHAVSEVIWTVQQDKHVRRKDWFNWSGVNNDDPIKLVGMTIEGRELFPLRPAKWFRWVEPRRGHTNIPQRHIYSRAFAEFPELETFASGAINLTLLTLCLRLMLQRGLGRSTLRGWGKNWNEFVIEPNGEASVRCN